VVAWLNAARMLTVFDKTDKFGAVLLQKLGALSACLFYALQQTACFVACQTGNLDRAFCDARLPKSDIARYRRLAVIHTTVCWILLLADVSVFTSPLFNNSLNWWSMTPFGVYVFVSDQLLVMAKLMTALLFMLGEFIWFFSHSVNYYSKVLHCTETRFMKLPGVYTCLWSIYYIRHVHPCLHLLLFLLDDLLQGLMVFYRPMYNLRI